MFQYFVTIVPTKLNTYKVSADTHQYSVTEQVALNLTQVCVYLGRPLCISMVNMFCVPLVVLQDRVINHAAGSHGVSGIFMKYDISSLMVKVTEQHMPLWQFLVRLCGIIGGIFSTTGTQKKHSLSVRCSFEGPHWSFVMSVASSQLLLLITLTTVLKSI